MSEYPFKNVDALLEKIISSKPENITFDDLFMAKFDLVNASLEQIGLSRNHIKQNDAIIIQSKKLMDDKFIKRILDQIKNIFPCHDILVLSGGISMTFVSKDEIVKEGEE